mgnify:CR=1 FL=1
MFDGIAIYNALRDHPATITVHIDALAASAASWIAQAGDKRRIAKTAAMMIHEPTGIARGDSATMLKMAEELDMVGVTISEIYAERAGGEPGEWRGRMAAESWYRGQEAVDIGLVDEMMSDSRFSNAAPPRVFNLSKFKNVPEDIKAQFAPRPDAVDEEHPHDEADDEDIGQDSTDDIIAAIEAGLKEARQEVFGHG